VKSNSKLAIGVVTGLFVGAAAQRAIGGQQGKTPPAYVISEVDTITAPTALQEYAAKAPETLRPFNGHFVVRGGKTESLDGDAPPKGIVVITFDSAAQAHSWYDSPAYASIRPLRLGAAKGRMFIVPGVAQ
jgi:uncharacterized protein (DUF1330 family)